MCLMSCNDSSYLLVLYRRLKTEAEELSIISNDLKGLKDSFVAPSLYNAKTE